MSLPSDFSAEERLKLLNAVQQAQKQIRWKSGKDVEHLQTRKRHGHLPQNADLDDYHTIILSVITSVQAQLYIYRWRDDQFPTIIAPYEGKVWLVMLGMTGILETAFPPTDPEAYLADHRFSSYGSLAELLR